MGLKDIFSSLKSSSSTSTASSSASATSNVLNTNNVAAPNKRNLFNNSNSHHANSKKNRYNLHNCSLDSELLQNTNTNSSDGSGNCLLINKINLNNSNVSSTSPTPSPAATMASAGTTAAMSSSTSFQASPILPSASSPQSTSNTMFVPVIIPVVANKTGTFVRRESQRSNTSIQTNESTRLLIENHAKHINSILNLNSNSSNSDYDHVTKYKNIDSIIKCNNKVKSPTMISSPQQQQQQQQLIKRSPFNNIELNTNLSHSSTGQNFHKKAFMPTSPSCDVALLASQNTASNLNTSNSQINNNLSNLELNNSSNKTPDLSNTSLNGSTRLAQSRSRIKTNPWIRSPSFHTTLNNGLQIANSTSTTPYSTTVNGVKSTTPNTTASNMTTTPNGYFKARLNHVRSHTNDDIASLNITENANECSEKKNLNHHYSKFNSSLSKSQNSLCKHCLSLKCTCMQKSKDSGIASISSANNNNNHSHHNAQQKDHNSQNLSPSPVLQLSSQMSPQTTFDSIITPKTVNSLTSPSSISTKSSPSSSSSSSMSSLNRSHHKNSIEASNVNIKNRKLPSEPPIGVNEAVKKPKSKTNESIKSDSLEQLRNNDDYSILFEEALESSSNDSYSISMPPKKQQNDTITGAKSNHFRRNSLRYSLDNNLLKKKSLLLNESLNKDELTANFVAEVTNLFDKALLELPHFTNTTTASNSLNEELQSPKFKTDRLSEEPIPLKSKTSQIPSNEPQEQQQNNIDEDDLELQESVHELYKQIEILKEQKKLLDEKMKIAKQETCLIEQTDNEKENIACPTTASNNIADICKFIKEIRL